MALLPPLGGSALGDGDGSGVRRPVRDLTILSRHAGEAWGTLFIQRVHAYRMSTVTGPEHDRITSSGAQIKLLVMPSRE